MIEVIAKYQRYAEYKDSGVEWLGEIPHEWRTSQLKRVACFITGMTPSTSVLAYYSDDISEYEWVRPEDIRENVESVQSTKYLTKLGWETQRAIPSKSVLLCCIGTIGKAAYNSYPLTTNQQITSVVLKNSSSKYYFYLLLAARTELEQMATGNVVKILNSERLGKLPIPVLSAQEAQKIANFLDHETAKIDSLIAKQEKLIELLKEKRQAVISHAVTKGLNPNVPMKDSGVEWLGQVPEHWVRYAIKNLCYVNDGNHGEEYPTEADFVENGEGVPFIRAGDFEDFRVVSKNLRYISHEKNNSMRKGRLQENDILFVNRGATIGKLCIIDKAYAGSNLNSQIAYLRADKTLVDYRYLTYFLSSLYTQTNIVSSIYGGALPQYPIQNIINLDVWSGGLEEQSMIADYLDEQVQIIVYLIGKCELAIKLLQERRTALISAAVTGKIDVRNWQNPNNNNEAKTEFSA